MRAIIRTPSKLVALFMFCLAHTASAELALSAPPRETPEAGQKLYGPLAEYLSKVTGEKIEYRHPDNWGIYQAMMTKGTYDLVFDGPHFVSWRIRNLEHVPLVALSGKLRFVIIARKDDSSIQSVADLAGKNVCGHAPPNLATLTLFDRFSNPSRQPRLLESKGFNDAYEKLLASKCTATVLPLEVHQKLDGEGARTKLLFTGEPYANQSLTAGPRVSAPARAKIIQALLSVEGQEKTRPLVTVFGGTEFLATTSDDYASYVNLLKNVWGFEPRR